MANLGINYQADYLIAHEMPQNEEIVFLIFRRLKKIRSNGNMQPKMRLPI